MEVEPGTELKCPYCGTIMNHKKLRGDEFFECPICKAEFWPYDERVEKAIRKTMYSNRSTKKYGKGSKRRLYKAKKPGEKWTPWWSRK